MAEINSRIPANVSQQYLVECDGNQLMATSTTSSSLNAVLASGNSSSNNNGKNHNQHNQGRNQDTSSCNNDQIQCVTTKEWIAVFILCFVNLINYMDRFTIAGGLFFCLFIPIIF